MNTELTQFLEKLGFLNDNCPFTGHFIYGKSFYGVPHLDLQDYVYLYDTTDLTFVNNELGIPKIYTTDIKEIEQYMNFCDFIYNNHSKIRIYTPR